MSYEINIAKQYTDALQGNRKGYAHYGLLKLPILLPEEAHQRFREVCENYPYPEWNVTLYQRTEYRTDVGDNKLVPIGEDHV